ncbi:MAG: 4Fe-4S ferredoxin [Firmicutes bacterium HGW-Firmicutes-14]|nr:MAG: 4Fe-4S ferredoxin [Firmicutes bacterium HGW-Firmicutes-14]
MGPKVDSQKCEGCETCIDVCPADVFEMDGDKAKPARPEDCLDCGACVEECPAEAITHED